MGKIFISIDLEMNKDATGKVDKIIQIGAVAFSILPFTIVEELNVIINPNEPIDPFIEKLTGITQEMANNGVDLQTGYGKLCELVIKHNAETIPVTWGGDDSHYLRDKVNAAGNTSKFIFGHRCLDVKTMFQTMQFANDTKPRSGLSKSMAKCGLKWIGQEPKHNALGDARNTALFYNYFCSKLKEPRMATEEETDAIVEALLLGASKKLGW